MPFSLGWLVSFVLAGWLALASAGLAQTVKNILVLHMESARLPMNALISKTLEDGLDAARISHVTFDEYLDENRLRQARSVIADSLEVKYAGKKLDLIITAGPQAFGFLMEYGNKLWPNIPKLYCLMDLKEVPSSLPEDITGIAGSLDFSPSIDLALQLQPDLKHVYYIGGATPQELGRQKIVQQDFKHFEDRLDFTYLNELPWADLLKKIHSLPTHSAVLFTTYFIDSTGQPFITSSICPSITAAANAPVYVPFDMLLHCGAIGGSVYSIAASAQAVTRMAVHVLKGEALPRIPVQETIANRIYVDRNQMERWGIPDDRVPADATLTELQPSLLKRYSRYLLSFAAILFVQLIIIIALFLQIRRKKRADLAVRLMSKRVIEAGEEERRHIARELHDDMGQRLSLLSFQLDSVNSQLHNGNAPAKPSLDEPLQELSTLITDVHKLSHRLHSSKLEHLGLKVAMTELCQHFSEKYGLAVDLRANAIPAALRGEAALCFYRVAQEAMNNVVKHSHAPSAQIVFSVNDGRVEMKIVDAGRGFDAGSAPIGLGLTTMEERVRALDGVFTLSSRAGYGTIITAVIPAMTSVDSEVSTVD